MAIKKSFTYGNDTIDPYPLIPGGLRKALVIKRNIFEELAKRYESFRQELYVNHKKESYAVEKIETVPVKKERIVHKRNLSNYEPSNAIYANESNYHSWRRVSEWFAQFGYDD